MPKNLDFKLSHLGYRQGPETVMVDALVTKIRSLQRLPKVHMALRPILEQTNIREHVRFSGCLYVQYCSASQRVSVGRKEVLLIFSVSI